MAETMIQQLKAAHNIDSRYMHARQQPFYSTLSLKSAADPVTGVISPQRISWFQSKVNTPGQGFPGALHEGLTNFQGAPSTMPSDQMYLALACGVRFLFRRNKPTPRGFLRDLTNGVASIHVRRGDSTVYSLGALEHLPCGRFGLSSRAVAAVGLPPASGDLSVVDYPQNGDSGLKIFPKGSELAFQPGSLIEVTLALHEPITLTDNGLPASSPADIRDAFIQFIFDGYSLSRVEG